MALQEALGNLFQSLETLEGAAAGQVASLKMAKQRDMFNGKNTIDSALVAKKLDLAIYQLESMLQEA